MHSSKGDYLNKSNSSLKEQHPFYASSLSSCATFVSPHVVSKFPLYVRSTDRSVKLRRNLAVEKKYVFIIKDMDILSKALMKFYGTEFHRTVDWGLAYPYKVRNCLISSKSLLEWVLISLILFYSLSSGLESFWKPLIVSLTLWRNHWLL